MNLIDFIKKNAKTNPKRIVLPESYDIRTLQAANYLAKEGICKPILLGNPGEIQVLASENSIELNASVELHDFKQSQHQPEYSNFLFEKRKNKGLSADAAKNMLQNELYYAASMVKLGQADGCVAGAVNTTGDVLRAAIHIIGLKPGSNVVSSIFLMSMPDGRVFTFGDCAVVPYPDASQLASIAVDSAQSHFKITGAEPAVAMLSFSTKGSAKHERADLVVEATSIAKTLIPALKIDGELQFDAALLPSIGQRKAPGSPVAGSANVFIFPNLDAGNIAYKITERLGNAVATGPIIQGLDAPMNDLSRGCSWEDIVNTCAVTSLQAAR